MKILAVDSSGKVASAAVMDEGALLGEETFLTEQTHSVVLLPVIEDLLKRLGLTYEDMDAYAVAAGPGSFTGLRIGAATVKALAHASKKPVAAVSTLEALAWNLAGTKGLVCPIMDARRNEVYTALYRINGQEMTAIKHPEALPVTETAAWAKEMGEPVTYLGDGVAVHRGTLKELLGELYLEAPKALRLQRAASVAELGLRAISEGKGLGYDEVKPEYLRVSQAERERAEREALNQ